MADSNRTQPRPGESDESDRDQSVEREGLETENRGNDATRARDSSKDEQSGDIDPDSAKSDVDRDDTIDEP